MPKMKILLYSITPQKIKGKLINDYQESSEFEATKIP
jgi:hypothetical protein